MKTTPFSQMAMSFRGRIINLWLRQTPGTCVDAANLLTCTAIEYGLIDRARPVPGTALKEWGQHPEKTPLWAAQCALSLMLKKGWAPESDEEWCGMSALLFRADRSQSLQQLLECLPDGIDKRVATGWLVAAIEEDARYRLSRKSK